MAEAKKGFLSEVFNPASIAKFALGAALGYVLMFPVESYMDAARTAFTHGAAGESFVRGATDNLGGVMPWVASLFGYGTAAKAVINNPISSTDIASMGF